MTRLDSKSNHDLEEFIEILKDSITLYKEGRYHQYRVMAVVLRALFVEKNQKPLFERVYPKERLHELVRENINPIELLEYMHTESQRSQNWRGLPFQKGEGRLSPENWLHQQLFNEDITIGQLIKSVADKESAHSDKNYDKTLKVTRLFRVPFRGYSHEEYIFYLGEYILFVLNKLKKDHSRSNLTSDPNA